MSSHIGQNREIEALAEAERVGLRAAKDRALDILAAEIERAQDKRALIHSWVEGDGPLDWRRDRHKR